MSELPPHARSWWTTFPGVLTGLAALITAGTGLLVALVQGGVLGPGPATPGQERQAVNPAPSPAAPVVPARPAPPPVAHAPPGPVPRPAPPDGVPALVLRETLDLGSMSVQVLDVQRSTVPNGLRVRVTYRIEAGDQTNGWMNFRDLFRLVADGAPRTMERTIIQPAGTQADYIQRLPANTAVDVVSEFLVPPAEDLVLHFTELLPDIPMAAKRGERFAQRRVTN